MRSVATCSLWFALLTGCSHSQPYLTDARLQKGLVIVLPGVHGHLWLSDNISKGLDAGGVESAIQVHDWTYQGWLLPFYNLWAQERNHRVANQIAQYILNYKREHPDHPVHLIGYSGGGPMAVWTAEAIPEGAQLDGVILLSCPLAPEYDLRRALSATKKGIVSFNSGEDFLYLALGTTVYANQDGQHGPAAGKVGFRLPPGAPGSAYEKLFQIPWNPRMAEDGHTGSHLTSAGEQFIADYVAPLVRAQRWDSQTPAQLQRSADRSPASPARSTTPTRKT